MTSTLAVFDTMEFIKPDVSTVCTGQAAAGTAVALAAGARADGTRCRTAPCRCSQPLWSTRASASACTSHAVWSNSTRRMRVMEASCGATAAMALRAMSAAACIG